VELFAVVGMHRSGTSLVSRILNLLGAHLGPEEDLMPAKPDNPTGFWESLTVTQLHDDLVAFLGGRWDRPPVLAEGWEASPALDPFVERIRDVVLSHYAGARLAVWKDPRGSLFLPLWRRVVPIQGTVLCVRDPDAVAASLAARDGLGAEHCAALWLRYVVAAWQADAGHLLVRFEDAAHPRELAGRLADFVGAPPPDEATLVAVDGFVQPDQRKERPRAPDPGPVMRLARAVHALVTTAPHDVVAPLLESLSSAWRVEAAFEAQVGVLNAVRGPESRSVVELLRQPP
jgi:hypothetical protein